MIFEIPPKSSNKTLIFCTSFAATTEEWNYRYKKWLDFLSICSLKRDQILLIDDGSPVLPTWKNLAIYKEPDLPRLNSDEIALFHFNDRLGRKSLLNYPGWYRSFIFSGVWAQNFGFNKIIHIESDSFIFSKELIAYINNLNTGWTSLFCQSQNLPETCVQIICEDQLKKFKKFSRHDYDINFAEKQIELFIPFTNVERKFVGDRYGELIGFDGIPTNADYAANIPSHWIEINDGAVQAE